MLGRADCKAPAFDSKVAYSRRPRLPPPAAWQPYTYQAFEGDGLDWNEFGVVLRKEDIPSLDSILKAIPAEAIRQKQEALGRVKLKFIWGATTFNPFDRFVSPQVGSMCPWLLPCSLALALDANPTRCPNTARGDQNSSCNSSCFCAQSSTLDPFQWPIFQLEVGSLNSTQ